MGSETDVRQPAPLELKSRPRWRNSIDLVATILMIVAAGLLIVLVVKALAAPPAAPAAARGAARPTPPPLPKDKVDLTGAILKGNPQAKIVMIEYSEFQCPFCGRYARETQPTLMRDYVESGKVQLAFRHLPLEAKHPLALRAAEAAECANQQAQFWPMEEALFADQAALDEASLFARARRLGFQEPRFKACMATVTPDKVRADAAGAATLEISGTPAFLIGFRTADQRVRVTNRIDGAKALSEFKSVLDRVTK